MTGQIKTPYYIIHEDKLRRNLELISHVSEQSGAKIIMAFKANALWKTFGIIRDYCQASTASSLNEMRLSLEFLGNDVHAYCPVYTDTTIGEFVEGCSHIVFNSVAQYEKYRGFVDGYNSSNAAEKRVSCGLRVNPECSVIEVNMGGGHLMTREGYDTDHLIDLLRRFRAKYPNLEVILEPGSAFTWRTGELIATVLDVVENQGVKTAIIDASFACHMPDCLEMPYKPAITEALAEPVHGKPTYRIGGNSCLSGDFIGDWSFDKPLAPGDVLTFEDMNHYTTVKTNMFNGIDHPSMVLLRSDGTVETLREFGYEDYRNRMD